MNIAFRKIRTALTASSAVGCLAFISLAAAQAPGAAPTDGAQTAGGVVVEAPERDPRFGVGQQAPPKKAMDEAREFLSQRKLKEGYNPKTGLFIAIGSEAISVPCGGGPDFENSRALAFQIALLNAKNRLADFIGVEVSSQVEKAVKQAPAGEMAPRMAPADTGPVPRDLVEKALTVLHDTVDDQLNKQGERVGTSTAEDNKKQADARRDARKKAEQLITQKEFKSSLSLFSQAPVSGLQAYRTFESSDQKGGEIAVVATYCKASGELAMALLGKARAPQATIPDMSVSDWVDGLSPEKDLLYTHGAQIRAEKNGEVVLVAFGMSTPAFDDPDLNQEARDAAAEDALGAARLLIGSMIEANTNSSKGQTVKVYADKSRDVKNTSQRVKTIKEFADKLKMPGVEPTRTWEAKHPCAKDKDGEDITTFGCVMKWSLTGAQAANQLGDLMKSIEGWRGGAGVTSRPDPAPAGAAPRAPKKPAPKSNSGAGAEGDLNPGMSGGPGAPGLR